MQGFGTAVCSLPIPLVMPVQPTQVQASDSPLSETLRGTFGLLIGDIGNSGRFSWLSRLGFHVLRVG